MYQEKFPCVYIITNKKEGTLYIGVTSNLLRRVWERKQGEFVGFTQKYRLHNLVYYEHFDTMGEAISCEKKLKNWHRPWKIKLIEQKNPEWQDLYDDLV